MRPEYGNTATLTPVSQTFASLQPDEFGANLQSLWQAAGQIADKVTELVTSERITPMQGIAITADVTARLFGVAEFNRAITPADLALLHQSYGNGG